MGLKSTPLPGLIDAEKTAVVFGVDATMKDWTLATEVNAGHTGAAFGNFANQHECAVFRRLSVRRLNQSSFAPRRVESLSPASRAPDARRPTFVVSQSAPMARAILAVPIAVERTSIVVSKPPLFLSRLASPP